MILTWESVFLVNLKEVRIWNNSISERESVRACVCVCVCRVWDASKNCTYCEMVSTFNVYYNKDYEDFDSVEHSNTWKINLPINFVKVLQIYIQDINFFISHPLNTKFKLSVTLILFVTNITTMNVRLTYLNCVNESQSITRIRS